MFLFSGFSHWIRYCNLQCDCVVSANVNVISPLKWVPSRRHGWMKKSNLRLTFRFSFPTQTHTHSQQFQNFSLMIVNVYGSNNNIVVKVQLLWKVQPGTKHIVEMYYSKLCLIHVSASYCGSSHFFLSIVLVHSLIFFRQNELIFRFLCRVRQNCSWN